MQRLLLYELEKPADALLYKVMQQTIALNVTKV
jgi:hypothetical protein